MTYQISLISHLYTAGNGSFVGLALNQTSEMHGEMWAAKCAAGVSPAASLSKQGWGYFYPVLGLMFHRTAQAYVYFSQHHVGMHMDQYQTGTSTRAHSLPWYCQPSQSC